jgi:hypothetical protein
MTDVMEFKPGGFRCLPGVFQYSAGVAALPGYEIRRVRFARPLPLAEGFARAAALIRDAGRPLTAFCACELRSPAPFTEGGFKNFNENYVVTLKDWGLFTDGLNPVARSNVCPELDPPSVPSFYAFSFTVEAASARPTAVIAGSGEASEGGASYESRTIRFGDTSAEAMRDKSRFVLGEMERRLGLLGFGWPDTTRAQVYTVHDIHRILIEEMVPRQAARSGVIWHYARPPVRDLEFEVDCAVLGHELVA